MSDSVLVERKSKMSGARIFTLGCGGLILAGVIAAVAAMLWLIPKAKSILETDPDRVTAEALIEAHPDLKIVSTDKKSRQITFTQSGTETTLSFEDIADGIFLPPAIGTHPPQWLETAINRTISDYRVAFGKTTGAGAEGAILARPSTNPKEIYDDLKTELEAQGFSFSSSFSGYINKAFKGSLTGSGDGRSVRTRINANPNENARVLIYYKERR